MRNDVRRRHHIGNVSLLVRLDFWLALGLLVSYTSRGGAQARACESGWTRTGADATSFPDTHWGTGEEKPPSASYVAHRLAGRYIVLVVTTHGDVDRTVSEWVLQLEAPPVDSLNAWARRYPPGSPARTAAYLLGNMNWQRATGHRPNFASLLVRLQYSVDRSDVTLQVGDWDILDGGFIYYVDAIDSAGTMYGRWTDGGTTMVAIETPLGVLVKHPQGYYCAWRMK